MTDSEISNWISVTARRLCEIAENHGISTLNGCSMYSSNVHALLEAFNLGNKDCHNLREAILAADGLLRDLYVGAKVISDERWGEVFTRNKALGCSSEELVEPR